MTSVTLPIEEPHDGLEDIVSRDQFIQKLRWLADALEKNPTLKIDVAGNTIAVPAQATYSIEFEAEEDEHELEFQIKWTPNT